MSSQKIRNSAESFFLLLIFFFLLIFSTQAATSELNQEFSSPVRIFRTAHFNFTYHSKDQKALQQLFESAEEILERLISHLPPAPPSLIKVNIASNNKEFQRLQLGPKAPEWVLALAYPKHGIIILKSPLMITRGHQNLLQTFQHELTHILLGKAFGSQSVPRWLQEGMAQLMEGSWDFNRITVMTRASLSDELIPLWELSRSFPDDLKKAEVAYAESYYFLSFILNRFGRTALKNFIQELSQGVDMDVALSRISGMRLREIISLWERYIKFRFNWIPILTGGGAMWFMASAVLVIGYAIKRRRTNRLLRQWELEEAMIMSVMHEDNQFLKEKGSSEQNHTNFKKNDSL